MSRFLVGGRGAGFPNPQTIYPFAQHSTVRMSSFIAKPHLYRIIRTSNASSKKAENQKKIFVTKAQKIDEIDNSNIIFSKQQMVYVQSSLFSTKTKPQNQKNGIDSNAEQNGSPKGNNVKAESNVKIDGKLGQNKQDKKKQNNNKSKNESFETSSNDFSVLNNNSFEINELGKIDQNYIQLEVKQTALVKYSIADATNDATSQILQNEVSDNFSVQNGIDAQNAQNVAKKLMENLSKQKQLVRGIQQAQNQVQVSQNFEKDTQHAGISVSSNGKNSENQQNAPNVQNASEETSSDQNTKNPPKIRVNETTLQESRQFFKALFDQPEAQASKIIQSVTSNRITDQMPVTQIKGVGKVHQELLENAGCAFVWQLLFYFQFRFGGDVQKLKDYLKEIGIRNHHSMITEHLRKEFVRNSVITLEGNIGAGKTTFLNALAPHLGSKIKVFEEPVQEWQEVNNTVKFSPEQPDNFNLLQEFYSHPDSTAFEFQSYVLHSKIKNMAYTKDPFRSAMEIPDFVSRDYLENLRKVHLLERSVYADRLVFVRSLHQQGQMNDQEVSIYDHWFNLAVNDQHTNLNPDGFVYLRAEPSVCEGRMRKRNRVEESDIDYSYLYGLHQMHEDWLHEDNVRNVDDDYVKDLLTNRRKYRSELQSKFQSPLYPNPNPYACNPEYQKVQELLYDALDITQLQKIPQVPEIFHNNKIAHLHFMDPHQKSHLNKYPGMIGVPTLEIDWNQDWDIHGDTERQLEVANIVEEFVDYVAEYKVLTRLPELFPSQFTYWD